MTGAKAEELIAEMVKDGKVRSTVEVAYDATKGTAEKVKDTVIAEANENVVDTTEYRSMENMGNYQKHLTFLYISLIHHNWVIRTNMIS